MIKGLVDIITNSLKIVDYAHHEVHEGNSFDFCEKITLGNGVSQDYIIYVPDGTYPHFGYTIDFNDGEGEFYIYELSDRNGTTLQSIFNRNRNSSRVSKVTIYKDFTGGTTDGNLICDRFAGSGKSLSGTVGTSLERILKTNSRVLIRVKNTSVSNNKINIDFNWYEK